jgi:hypothetical protein
MTVLLDSPPHEVHVFPQRSEVDSYGNAIERPSTDSVIVKCFVSRPRQTTINQSAERSFTNTLLVTAPYDAPIQLWSRIKYNNEFYSVESIDRHDASESTRHLAAVIRLEQ